MLLMHLKKLCLFLFLGLLCFSFSGVALAGAPQAAPQQDYFKTFMQRTEETLKVLVAQGTITNQQKGKIIDMYKKKDADRREEYKKAKKLRHRLKQCREYLFGHQTARVTLPERRQRVHA